MSISEIQELHINMHNRLLPCTLKIKPTGSMQQYLIHQNKGKIVTSETTSILEHCMRMMDLSSLFCVGLFKAIVKFSPSKRTKVSIWEELQEEDPLKHIFPLPREHVFLVFRVDISLLSPASGPSPSLVKWNSLLIQESKGSACWYF